MPEKYHIKTGPVPPRRPRIGKFGVVDWREDCAGCHNTNSWSEVTFNHELVGATNCQNCHGADAAGLAMFRGSLEEFRARLAFSENMPDMSGLLTADEVAAIYAFVVAAQLQSP